MQKDLSKLSTEELGKLFPIIIEEYKPEWPILFQLEKQQIINLLPDASILKINHIGSTAIPGIMSKPTIDILLEVTEQLENETIIKSFTELAYHCIPKPENPSPHLMFVKGYSQDGFKGQAFHVHVRYFGNWDEIYFRNYLIAHPETANSYEKLKLKLVKKHKNNREEYTEAKTDFIEGVMILARKKDVELFKNLNSNEPTYNPD